MIEFTRNHMYKTQMATSIEALANMQGFKDGVIRRLNEVITQFSDAYIKTEINRMEIVSKYYECDESGKLKTENGAPVYKPGMSDSDYKQEIDTWGAVPIVLSEKPFELYEINPGNTFTPKMFMALKPLIKDAK